jgi:heat shock protein HtpX
MSSQPPVPTIPPRRSLAFFAVLALLMVVVSYVFILVLAAACVYLPWLVLSNLTNFQTLALFVAGLVVAGSMLWSLVPRRVKFVAPGLPLERSAHPQLFAEIDQIATALQEPVPREVYLIGEPNAWVTVRGGMMGFGGQRIMGLGLPLLGALNISQFRAILAHEFAHYYGGDTKLGPLLHRTQMAMVRTFQNMGSVGTVMRVALMQLLYKGVFGILNWYWLLFLRAINFVSRRQEFRADELACIVAGPQSLASGLNIVHIVGRAWPGYWRAEVLPLLNQGCLPSIAEGFAMFLAAPGIAKQAAQSIETEMREGKTEPYDSHPPLRDRIAASRTFSKPSQPEDPRPAWSLLEDGMAAEKEFLEMLNPDLPKDALKRVAWEDQGSSVLIPSWTSSVTEYGAVLKGITVGNLSESMGKIPEIAAYIPDPRGMLLTRQQRTDRARSFLGTAFALALVKNGWLLHASPGEFHLGRGEEKLDPHQLVSQLLEGGISREAWMQKCKTLGLENLPLVAATAIPPENQSTPSPIL